MSEKIREKREKLRYAANGGMIRNAAALREVGSMDGIFIQKRFGLCRWLLLGSGILLALLFSFLLFVDNAMSPEDKAGCRIILVLSLVIVALCLISHRFNRGAFLHLGEGGLTARFAWRVRLQCPYSNIAFCSCSGMTLTLRLQNEKRYIIPLLNNAAVICSELRKRIGLFRPELPDRVELARTLVRQKRKYRKWTICAFGALLLAVIGIVVSVLLTGGNTDTHTDQMIIAAALCLFVGLCAAAFFFAGKGGRWLADANETAMLLREYVLKTAPLPHGHVRGVYLNGDLTARTIVYGDPNSDSGYYVRQELDENLDLATTYTSKVTLDIGSLQDVLAPPGLNDEA